MTVCVARDDEVDDGVDDEVDEYLFEDAADASDMAREDHARAAKNSIVTS